MSRLPDALLVRDTWLGGAKEALAAIRSQGRLARITTEVRPRRARASERKTTIYADRRDRRYMWIVWEAAP